MNFSLSTLGSIRSRFCPPCSLSFFDVHVLCTVLTLNFGACMYARLVHTAVILGYSCWHSRPNFKHACSNTRFTRVCVCLHARIQVLEKLERVPSSNRWGLYTDKATLTKTEPSLRSKSIETYLKACKSFWRPWITSRSTLATLKARSVVIIIGLYEVHVHVCVRWVWRVLVRQKKSWPTDPSSEG